MVLAAKCPVVLRTSKGQLSRFSQGPCFLRHSKCSGAQNIQSKSFHASCTVSAPTIRIAERTNEGDIQRVALWKPKTLAWLELPIGHWSSGDVAVGRSLWEGWLRLPHSHPDRALWATKILDRWIREYASPRGGAVLSTGGELVHMLHRVLFAWRVALTEGHCEHSHVYHHARKLLMDLEELYQETQKDTLRPKSQAYTMLLQILALLPDAVSNPVDEAVELLELCKRTDGPPNVLVWNACLHVMAKSSRRLWNAPERAQEVLDGMVRGVPLDGMRPPKPDVVSFSTVINAWANSPRVEAADRAHAILDRMMALRREKNVPAPNRTCYNTVLGAHARSQGKAAAKRAQDLLFQMQASQDAKTRPDRISLFWVLAAWAKAADEPKAAEQAEALLDAMQQLYDETGEMAIRPTAACHALVLDVWSRRPNSGAKVEALLRRMEAGPLASDSGSDDRRSRLPAEGGDPHMGAHIAAIRAWGNTTDDDRAPERAERWLEGLLELSSLDPAARVKAYTEAMAAWSKSDRPDAPRRALAILDRMRADGLAPDRVAWNHVLNAHAQKGDVESALALFEEMHAANAQPDAVSYTMVINALARARNYPKAAHLASELLAELVELYSEQRDESLKPTEVTFATAILAWSNSGELDCGEQAERILLEMMELPERLGGDTSLPRPNTAICNSVLRAWYRASDAASPKRAEELLAWMHDQVESVANVQVRPDRMTHNYVLKIWARSGRVSAVRHIENHLNRMIQAGDINETLPNAFSYNCLLEALKNSSRSDRAEQCLSLLKQQLYSSSQDGSNRLWDLHSFHLVFMACMPLRSGQSKERDDAGVSTIVQAFELLKSIEDPTFQISAKTVWLILHSYCSTGLDEESFFQEVLQFSFRSIDNFDSGRILASLRRVLPEDNVRVFVRTTQEMTGDVVEANLVN